jgi:peptidoglycan-associated lipoprotein
MSPKTTALTATLFALSALLGACSSTPIAPPAPAPAPVAPAPAPAPAPMPVAATPMATPTSAVTTVTLPAYLDPKSPISTARSVYFGYDEFFVKQEYDPIIERQGRYLAANPNLAIKIEGNADERGSAEYNLALGQKRAEAVKQALKIAGVKDSQMEPISWGKERPKATGHDESAWAQNRRADLQYPNQ